MEPRQTCEERDLASTNLRTALTWGPGILLMIVTGPLGGWGRVVGWAAGLVYLGALCLWNYSRCRRVHCMFTGPFFLGMAVVTLLVGAGAISLGRNSWAVIGNIVLLGGVALCCGPELLWGRYRRPRSESEASR